MNPEIKRHIRKKLQSVPERTLTTIYRTLEGDPERNHGSLYSRLDGKGRLIQYTISPGVYLSQMTLLSDRVSFRHEPDPRTLEITYSRYGRVGWEMPNRNTVYIGPGDLSIHTMDICPSSTMVLPLQYYEGIQVNIQLDVLKENLPEVLAATGMPKEPWDTKFCKNGTFAHFPGGEESASIFEPLFHVPDYLKSAYYKLKTLELLLYLETLSEDRRENLTPYRADQIRRVKEIQREIQRDPGIRTTIDELSEKYLMNPTTLKTVFKSVYGTSLGAYRREQTMERAATLLRETDDSVRDIAKAMGYKSQSKFTAAFKERHGATPTDYRKGRNN